MQPSKHRKSYIPQTFWTVKYITCIKIKLIIGAFLNKNRKQTKEQVTSILLLQRLLCIISLEKNLLFHPLHKNQSKLLFLNSSLLRLCTLKNHQHTEIATIFHIWILQAYTNTVCGFVHRRGCCTVKNAPSNGRTLLSFMRGSAGAPWGETTPRINDMRDMHCVTPMGCGGDAGMGYLNSPSSCPQQS